MDANSIHSLGGDCFHMQSAMDSLHKYLVDLGNQSCDCPDWPKVRLCKHVSAVHHFFGHSDLQPVGCPKTPPPNGEVLPDVHSDGAATATILENVINVSRGALSDGVPSSMDTIQSLQAVEAHLTAVVHSTCSLESLLLDQEQIPPNLPLFPFPPLTLPLPECMYTHHTIRDTCHIGLTHTSLPLPVLETNRS